MEIDAKERASRKKLAQALVDIENKKFSTTRLMKAVQQVYDNCKEGSHAYKRAQKIESQWAEMK